MANRNLDSQVPDLRAGQDRARAVGAAVGEIVAEKAAKKTSLLGLVVAYLVPHNDGVEFGIITGPGFDTELTLIDLYEVDGTVKSLGSEADADAWLEEKFGELNIDLSEVKTEEVPGGARGKVRYY